MSEVRALKPGQVVSFKLNTNLLPDVYSHVVVQAITDYSLAMTITNTDVAAVHANIYSTLPQGTPPNAQDYDYLIVKLASGERVAVGIPWILTPVQINDTTSLHITVNQASVSDGELIAKDLQSRGFTDFTINVV